jgi:hypothetical protein
MRKAKYHIKKRTFELSKTKNPYRPRGQVTYGPWVRITNTEDKDYAPKLASRITGLYDVAIFYRGKMVWRNGRWL